MEITTFNDGFSLDGVSCGTVGLWCDTPPIQILAEEKGSYYSVGRDTELYASDDSYKDISFKFTCYAWFSEDFDTSNIYAFLHGKKKLSMTRNDGYYWKIRSVSCTPSEKMDGKRIKYQITFKCAPWRYFDNEAVVTLTGAENVQNAGTRFCMPKYTLHLSALTGIGSFTVNGQQVTITIPTTMGSNVLVVDSENAIAYDGNNVIRTQYTSGIYPYMNLGNNWTTFGGIISSIDIQRNERCY